MVRSRFLISCLALATVVAASYATASLLPDTIGASASRSVSIVTHMDVPAIGQVPEAVAIRIPAMRSAKVGLLPSNAVDPETVVLSMLEESQVDALGTPIDQPSRHAARERVAVALAGTSRYVDRPYSIAEPVSYRGPKPRPYIPLRQPLE